MKKEISLKEYTTYFINIQKKLEKLKKELRYHPTLTDEVQELMDKNPFKSYKEGDFPIKDLSSSSCVILGLKGGTTYFGMPSSSYNKIKPKLDRINAKIIKKYIDGKWVLVTKYRKIFVIPTTNACKCFYGCFTSENVYTGSELLFNPYDWKNAKFMKIIGGVSRWLSSSAAYNNYYKNYVFFELNASNYYKVCAKQNFANNSNVTSGSVSSNFNLNAVSGAASLLPAIGTTETMTSVKDNNASSHCLQDELLFSADGTNIFGDIGNLGTARLLLTLTPESQDLDFLKFCAGSLPIGFEYITSIGGTKLESSETEEIFHDDTSFCSCGCIPNPLVPGSSGGLKCETMPVSISVSKGGIELSIYYCPYLNKCNKLFNMSGDYVGGREGFTGRDCANVGECPLPPADTFFVGQWYSGTFIGMPKHVSLLLLYYVDPTNLCVGSIETICKAIEALIDLQIKSNIGYYCLQEDQDCSFGDAAGFRNSISYDMFSAPDVSFNNYGIYIEEMYGGDSDRVNGRTGKYENTKTLKLFNKTTENGCDFYKSLSSLGFYMKILK